MCKCDEVIDYEWIVTKRLRPDKRALTLALDRSANGQHGTNVEHVFSKKATNCEDMQLIPSPKISPAAHLNNFSVFKSFKILFIQ